MEKRRGTKNREEINTRVGNTDHGDLQKSGRRRTGHERPQIEKKNEEKRQANKEECQGMEKRRETKNGEEINTRKGMVGGTPISHYHEPRDTGDEGLQRRRVVKGEGRDCQ